MIRTGTAHRARARADASWLASVIRELEADDQLRSRLTVIASDLLAERDGHLVISHRPGEPPGGPPERVQVRATAPVRAALDAARSPIRIPDLADTLAAGFPEATSEVITGLIARLVSAGFLITSLRAPMTAPDPLATLLAEMEAVTSPDDARASGLPAVSASLARHNAASSPAAARDERRRAAALMASIRPMAGPPLAVDLRLDWDLGVPEAVTAEAASAAGVLARLARRPALSAGWAAWHARFLDRYGPGAIVPVLDAVDDAAGLGFPAGYLGSPHAGHASPLTSRDNVLLRLAQQAVMRREQEIAQRMIPAAAYGLSDDLPRHQSEEHPEAVCRPVHPRAGQQAAAAPAQLARYYPAKRRKHHRAGHDQHTG